jgi:tRNA(Arg) A34 adenosine deaminase TadA
LQSDNNIFFLRKALDVAKRSMEKGNLPFGCILVDDQGNIIEEGENTVITSKDNIGHCEINLVHQLSGKYDWEYLNHCTVFASTEPCPMCAAAIYWSGIGKLVFALSKDGYHAAANTTNSDYIFNTHAKDLLSSGGRRIEITGPLMEKETAALYAEWLKSSSS